MNQTIYGDDDNETTMMMLMLIMEEGKRKRRWKNMREQNGKIEIGQNIKPKGREENC